MAAVIVEEVAAESAEAGALEAQTETTLTQFEESRAVETQTPTQPGASAFNNILTSQEGQSAAIGGFIGTSAISDVFNLASGIVNSVTYERTKKESLAKEKRDRHKTGILIQDEDRKALTKAGKLPENYSDDSIRKTIKSGRLPPGWSAKTAVQQGYGDLVGEATYRAQQANVQNIRNEIIKRNKAAVKLALDLSTHRLDLETAALIRNI